MYKKKLILMVNFCTSRVPNYFNYIFPYLSIQAREHSTIQ